MNIITYISTLQQIYSRCVFAEITLSLGGAAPFDHVIFIWLITFHEVCIVSSYRLRKIKMKIRQKRM